MTTPTAQPCRRPAGQGSQRERRPGVWEVRVPLGRDATTNRTRHRSVTVHGDADQASAVRDQLIRDGVPATTRWPTLGEVLATWLRGDHAWRPSTLIGYRSVVRALAAEPLGKRPAIALTPDVIRAALASWRDQGHSDAVIAGRFRVLRSALGWAYTEHLIDAEPLRRMRGPGRCRPRLPVADDDVRVLLNTAELHLLEALANGTASRSSQGRLHRAEQTLLLVRLAADTGARRGELAALRLDDLDGTVLTIDRAVSGGQLTSPKSGHGRSLTVGATTAGVWHELRQTWSARLRADGTSVADEPETFGPWLFSSQPNHRHRLRAETLGHYFTGLRDEAGVPAATLHRLRHNVATFLVSHGQILQAQARLGHADAATTLREYAYALPLTDQGIADQIDRHLAPQPELPTGHAPPRP